MRHTERSRRERPRVLLLRGLLLLLLSLPGAHALAQSSAERGDAPSSGQVRDATGMAIPQATVVVRHEASGLQQILDTAPDGTFGLAPVVDGRYQITASAEGFAPQSEIVDLPLAAPLTFTLTPAAIVEQVTIVSASRQEELRDTLNTRVDVIGRTRIQESGSQTVGELLRELPGVLSRRNSEGAGVAGEQIQGIDSRQVLVLLDGQPLVAARGIKSGLINLDRQSTNRLERVEIVKGASSALYGSDAIGGVINLISREVADQRTIGGELSGGSLGEVNAVGEVGFRQARWTGLLTAERHRRDSFDLTPSTFDTTGAPFTRHDFLGRLRAQVTPSIGLSTFVNGYANHARGRSNGELGPQEDDIEERTVNVNGAADWLPRATTSVQARGYAARYDESSTGRLAPPASTPLEPGELDERLVKIDTSVSQVIGTRQQLQAGVEYWRDEYSGLNRVRTDSGVSATTRVGWVQYRVSAGDRVIATVGGRLDNHSEFGSAFSPKIAANARLTDGLRVRLSLGRGFRAPDLGQLFYRFLNPSNLYQVIGNPNLEPEYATSLQVGGEFTTPGQRARVGVNAFRNDVRDLINSVNLGFVATQEQLAALLAREGLDPTFRPVPGRLLLTYRNVAEAVTHGIELDGEWAPVRGVSVGGAYTRLNARDEVTGLALTLRHDHQGHVRVAWMTDRVGLHANLRGTFYSSWIASRATVGGVPVDTRAPGFSLWDAFVSQRIVRGVTGFVAVDNLTDNQDPNTGKTTATGAPASLNRLDVGRTFRTGMRLSWTR